MVAEAIPLGWLPLMYFRRGAPPRIGRLDPGQGIVDAKGYRPAARYPIE